MAYRYVGKNTRPFSAITQNNYGRTIIYTNQNRIDENNIVKELSNALSIHQQNATEIEYLDRYYRGDQPILYRKKLNRPEINNKVVMNLAYELVERKTAEMCAEPIQFVLRGTDDKKSEEISKLNAMLEVENKHDVDIDICRWRSICGTAYRYIGKNENLELLDVSDFDISCENPLYTFVAYYNNNKPAFSCQIRTDSDGANMYWCFTDTQYFVIKGGIIVKSGINGNKAIPVIEYPNNSRRISDIEITISLTDHINTLQSDRINGIEQFVASWVKFVNCEIDANTFSAMRDSGALVVKSNNGENKADVDLLTQELNQTEGQVVFNDLFEKFLSIQGLSDRQSKNSGGDSGNAVAMRNGFTEASMRVAIGEPIFKKAERLSLRIILNRLRITNKFTLSVEDLEIHINHNKADNILTKSESLKMLLDSGINYKRAIKTVDLFSDPEQVADESKARMEILYPTEIKAETNNQVETKVIE
jgi:SPP1 family phage portal protein